MTEERKTDKIPSAPESLVIEAATVEEALAAAAERLRLAREDLRAEVVGSEKGFLGLFGNKLKVEVTPVRPVLLLRARDFAKDLLGLMGLSTEISFLEDGTVEIGGLDSDILVGRHGDGLKAMEYLLNLALRDPRTEPRVRLDSNGYRERRMKSLERLAEATARQAVDYGRPIRLDPMLSWERWVIHTTLKDRDDVTTESVGESPHRKVVVIPKADLSSSRRSRDSRGPRGPRRRWSR